jgi:hypothetical protein
VQQRSNSWLKLSFSKTIIIFKIHYMVISCFCKIYSHEKRETSQGDFSIGCGAQLA